MLAWMGQQHPGPSCPFPWPCCPPSSEFAVCHYHVSDIAVLAASLLTVYQLPSIPDGYCAEDFTYVILLIPWTNALLKGSPGAGQVWTNTASSSFPHGPDPHIASAEHLKLSWPPFLLLNFPSNNLPLLLSAGLSKISPCQPFPPGCPRIFSARMPQSLLCKPQGPSLPGFIYCSCCPHPLHRWASGAQTSHTGLTGPSHQDPQH